MDFWDDDRAQSVQVGAVLLFAVLVILLAGYQSTVVPNDNRSAEFDHSLETEQDMMEVRNAIVEAYQDGESSPVSVRLGTTYPRHTFAVNPAPVSGSLRTSDAGTITVTENGNPVSVCPTAPETKYLNYSAGYNYYSPAPTLVYENTVLYADYGEGRRVMLSDQALVSGDTVDLLALQGEYSENGIGTTDFQARAGPIDTTDRGDYNVTVPTRLSSETWERTLSESGHDVTVTETGDGRVEMAFTDKQIRCSAVGADGTPRGGVRSDTDEQDGDGSEINPPRVRLESTSHSNGNDQVTLTVNNSGGTVQFVEGRINFYRSSTPGEGDDPTAADVYSPDVSGTPRATFDIGGDLQSIEPEIEVTGEETTEIVLDFDGGGQKDWFVITFYDESGDQYQYFVGL